MSEHVMVPSLSARQRRAVNELVKGPVDREVLDRVAGSTNSPDVVRQLRGKGIGIYCQRVDTRDRDGHACWFGRYSLTPEGRQTAQRWGWFD